VSASTDRPAGLRWLRRLTAATTAAGVMLLGAPVVADFADPAARLQVDRDHAGVDQTGRPGPTTGLRLVSAHPRTHRWRGHPNRRIRHYTVRHGDTALGLAVRFHAWTDELLRLNHLTLRSRLHVGEHVRIPVVVSAARRAHRSHKARAHQQRSHRQARQRQRTHHRRPTHHRAKPHPPHHRAKPHRAHHKAAHRAHRRTRHHATHHRSRWRGVHASRATVRRVVARTARRHDVGPALALAVAWHESGWQQHRVSPSGALGVMQVMPATGRWLSSTVGRRLHLRRLRDNVTAGVLLLKMLRAQVGPRGTMAGYYQGLGSVQRYGMYPSTRRYVATVSALRKRIRHGWDPA
jgi:hypothetical protein